MLLLLAMLLQAEPVERLVEKLRADDVAVRDAAERELVKLGEAARPALKKALEAEKEPEARARLASVVAKIEKPLRYATTSRDWVLNAEKRIGDVTILVRVTGAGDAWKVCNGSWIRRVTPPRALVDDLHALALEADLLDRHDSRMASDRKMILGVELATAAGRGQWEFDLVKPPGALEQKMMELVERAASLPSDDLIALLSSPEIDKRDAAERDLVRLGEAALPELRRVLWSEKEAEAKARLASVVAKIEKPIRYGRGKATWRVRLTFEKRDGPLWFIDLAGDGGGTVVPWQRQPLVYALYPTREQLDELIELAIAADILDGDFAAVEKGPTEMMLSVLEFENGAHTRKIRIGAPREEIPEPLRKFLYFLQAPLADPAKMKGREAGDLAADLRGPGAEAAERAFRRMGKAAMPALQRTLSSEREESVKNRIEKLLEELKK